MGDSGRRFEVQVLQILQLLAMSQRSLAQEMQVRFGKY